MTTAAKIASDHGFTDPQPQGVAGDIFDRGRKGGDAHQHTAVVETPPGHPKLPAQSRVVSGAPEDWPAFIREYHNLRCVAEMFWDTQQARISTHNRVMGADVDVMIYADALSACEYAEKACRLGLTRQYRRTVDDGIRAWQKETRGVGEHLLASLLGVVGHPVWAERHCWVGSGSDRRLYSLGVFRRRVSDLWAYCGHGDPDRRPRRGMSAEEAALSGSPRAKRAVWLLSCAQLKSRGAYRDVYDAGRERYQERDWTDGHRHNAALRLVGKALLKDLWLAAGGAADV